MDYTEPLNIMEEKTLNLNMNLPFLPVMFVLAPLSMDLEISLFTLLKFHKILLLTKELHLKNKFEEMILCPQEEVDLNGRMIY